MKKAGWLSLVSAGLLLGSGQVFAQEVDDVYFTPKDRGQAVYLSNADLRAQNANLVNDLKDSPMRSKFANPDFQAGQVNNSQLAYFKKDYLTRPSYFNGMFRNPYNLSFVNGFNGWGRAGLGFGLGMGMNPWMMNSMGMGWGMDPWMMNQMAMWGDPWMMNSGFGMNPWMMNGMGMWGMDPWMMNSMGWGGWGMDPWMMGNRFGMGWGGGWGMNSWMMANRWGWGGWGMSPWCRPAVLVDNQRNTYLSTANSYEQLRNTYYNDQTRTSPNANFYQTANNSYYGRNTEYGNFENSSINRAGYAGYAESQSSSGRQGTYDWGQGRSSGYNGRNSDWNMNRSSSSWGGSSGSYGGGGGGGASYGGGERSYGGRGGRGN
ncbi:MAG: hypothetical protein MUC97_12720 [Bernardetiaceae bacterium]|jgi:hypothetical protein|nr:hypothetical protein [Bernardetiaceae bacterium]